MKLRVASRLEYDFPDPCEMVLQIEVAHRPGQTILDERLSITPQATLVRRDDEHGGDRRIVMDAVGTVVFDYRADVEVAHRETRLVGLEQQRIADLPPEVLSYLRPSAYCPSDRYEPFVHSQFGDLSGGARVQAILDWIANELEYRHGSSTSTSTAHDTFLDRAGVCRDFAHLTITLLRASDMPARMVSAYAWKLDPPDFHAVVEVFVGGSWWVVDPTNLAPLDGLVPIASGRDAADVAFMTIFGKADMIAQSVTVSVL